MHDEQLRRLLRTLEDQPAPDPDFADALFNRLGTVARNRRRSRVPAILLAATIGLVVLTAGFAIGSGLVRLPFTAETPPNSTSAPSASVPVDSSSPTPSASISIASGSPTPSASTSRPSPTAVPELALSTIVAPVVEGVTVRQTPGTAGIRVGTLAIGARTFVMDGPVAADGYQWYQLSALGFPRPGGGCTVPLPTDPLACPNWMGWAAIADAETGEPWVLPADGMCPDPATDLAGFLAVQPVLALGCYGDEPVTFVAWWPEEPTTGRDPECEAAAADLAWLVCTYGTPNGLGDTQGQFGYMFFAIDPASGLTMPPRGQWIEVTGRHEHPAAVGCDDIEGQAEVDPVVSCRSEFVVSAAMPAPAP